MPGLDPGILDRVEGITGSSPVMTSYYEVYPSWVIFPSHMV